MGLSATVWRLTDARGRLAQCIISERDGRWHLMVRQGTKILIAERCPSDDAALMRANEILDTLKERGWIEPLH
ncbi:MAG TPA: hypothetical protein VFV95_15325 [Vicinamibacterales bacterium]|nr:hypothetical protein [Vicinamibacterales bacterium]